MQRMHLTCKRSRGFSVIEKNACLMLCITAGEKCSKVADNFFINMNKNCPKVADNCFH